MLKVKIRVLFLLSEAGKVKDRVRYSLTNLACSIRTGEHSSSVVFVGSPLSSRVCSARLGSIFVVWLSHLEVKVAVGLGLALKIAWGDSVNKTRLFWPAVPSNETHGKEYLEQALRFSLGGRAGVIVHGFTARALDHHDVPRWNPQGRPSYARSSFSRLKRGCLVSKYQNIHNESFRCTF